MSKFIDFFSPPASITSEEELLAIIEAKMLELLEGPTEKLFDFFYRFDLNERAVAYALNFETTREKAKALADEVWKRQKNKMDNWNIKVGE
ncbi:MAG: hypothetical protein H6620_06210 [Halobacteriovoraceae bacterium]|nr:hypothetical protein [Halobacteriovoraceae bacterium]